MSADACQRCGHPLDAHDTVGCQTIECCCVTTREDTAATNERETLKLARTHRPNYVVEAPGTKHEWTRIKCDGHGCDFYAERHGRRNWFLALDDHAEHLAQVLDDREATLRVAVRTLLDDCDKALSRENALGEQVVGVRLLRDRLAALAAADGSATPAPVATTVTEWEWHDGTKWVPLDPGRVGPTMFTSPRYRSRQRTSYADRVTNWAPADGEATK